MTSLPVPEAQDRLLALQNRLQHRFTDPNLLLRAVTHRSYSADHNERLEFLGDAILNMSVAALLYDRLKTLPEGDLSRIRANLVKQDTLQDLAHRLQLAQVLRLGDGEARSGGFKRPSILADAVEAIIGAVFLDAGFAAADALVQRLFQGLDIQPQMAAMGKDPKTELQELLQGRKLPVPSYKVVVTTGAAHKQTFDVECEVPALNLRERGIGGSRRAGEQAAAAAMLVTLKGQ